MTKKTQGKKKREATTVTSTATAAALALCPPNSLVLAVEEGSTTRVCGSSRQQLRCVGATRAEAALAGLPWRRRRGGEGEGEGEGEEDLEANKCRRRGSLVRPRLLLLRAAKGNGTPPNPPTTCSSPRSCPRSVPTRRCSLRSGPGRSKGTGRGRSCSASSSRKGRGGRGSSREVRLRRLRALRPRPRTKSRVLASSRRWEG